MTWARGKATWAISDKNQAPLPSPPFEASSVSIVIGPESGPAPSVVAFMRPKNAPTLTFPFLIGRNHHRSGMCSDAEWSEAARSGVRVRHDASFAQRDA